LQRDFLVRSETQKEKDLPQGAFHSEFEIREWDYWFIDCKIAADSIKYKVSCILDSFTSQQSNRAQVTFKCNECGHQYDQHDMLSLGSNGYQCEQCNQGTVVQEQVGTSENSSGGMARPMVLKELKPLLDQMKKVENLKAPLNPWKQKANDSFQKNLREREANRSSHSFRDNKPAKKPKFSDKIMNHTGNEKIEIKFSARETHDDNKEEEKQLKGIPFWLEDEGEHQYDEVQVVLSAKAEAPSQAKKAVSDEAAEEIRQWYIDHPFESYDEDNMQVDEAVLNKSVTVQGIPFILKDVFRKDSLAMTLEEYRIYAQLAKEPEF